jgi:WD40 repeat protein
MRTAVLAVVALAIGGCACAVRAQNPAPLLPSTSPLRRLGTSEFRLPLGDSNERAFAFSRDSKLLAGCNGRELRVWTFPDGELKHDLSDAIDTEAIVFSADGRELLALEWRGRGERAIVRFNVNSGKRVRINPLDYVRQDGGANYTFLDHGRWVCSMGSRLSVWDGMTGRLMLLKPSVSGSQPVASQGVLTLNNGTGAERIELKTGNRLTRFSNHAKRASAICSPDGTLMAGYSTDEKAVVFWTTESNDLVGGKIPIEERQWQSSHATLSGDGKQLVLWTGEGGYFEPKISVYDVESARLISKFAPPDINFTDGPIVSPDGKWVFLSAERCVFTSVNLETGQPLDDGPDHIKAVEALPFTPDGSTLIAGSSDQRRAWSVGTGEPGTQFLAYPHTPYVAAVDNQRALISGLPEGGIQLQEIATGKVERLYNLGKRMHLSKFQLAVDRKSFSGQTENTFRRWSVDTGEVLDEWALPKLPYLEDRRPFGRYTFGGFALGGKGLFRFEEDRPAKRLPDGSIAWGEYSLLLEDWRTQQVQNRIRLPDTDHFAIAEADDVWTVALVTSDNWSVRASNRLEPGMTYLMVWERLAPRERMRITRRRPDFYGAFSHVAITRDGRLVATVRNRTQIELWSVDRGELVQQFDAPIDLATLAFSDDGAILATGHVEGSICLWDTAAAAAWAQPPSKADKLKLLKQGSFGAPASAK